MLFLDFETRSTVDLTKCGADVYARHPSTEILCVGFAFDKGPVQLWIPGMPDPGLDCGEHVVVAHNAGFELAIWNQYCTKKYGWEPLSPENVLCTMAMSYAMACPGALADAAPAFGMQLQKDSAGHRAMLQVSQPRKVTENGCIFCEGGIQSDSTLYNFGIQWVTNTLCPHCFGSGHLYEWYTPENAPEKFEKLYAYCKQDIEVERGIFQRVARLSPQEQKLWVLDRKINDRGVQIDLDAVNAAILIVEAEKKRFDEEMREVTCGGVATATATGQLTNWLILKGLPCTGVAKADIADYLKIKDLASDVRRALLIRQEASKSSTAKLKAMINGVCADGRLRGMYQFHGAQATGRFAGRRVQLQNMMRSTMPQADIEGIFEILAEVDDERSNCA